MQERQQSADSLASAQEELDHLNSTHQRLQQQLQVKVLDLQQTRDSLEERVRQYSHLHSDSESQLAQLTQLRAELQSSNEARSSLQQELALKTGSVSGVWLHCCTHSSSLAALFMHVRP